ncbi:hypothetical protein ACXZ66_08450 [Corynebacterium sp. S7]
MTVLNGKVAPRNPANRSYAQVVPSASTWDLGLPGELNEAARNSSTVRTLSAKRRTPRRNFGTAVSPVAGRAQRIESRRERGGILLAGTLMGMSFIVSAAIGGAFEPATPQPATPVDYVAEISSTAR